MHCRNILRSSGQKVTLKIISLACIHTFTCVYTGHLHIFPHPHRGTPHVYTHVPADAVCTHGHLHRSPHSPCVCTSTSELFLNTTPILCSLGSTSHHALNHLTHLLHEVPPGTSTTPGLHAAGSLRGKVR